MHSENNTPARTYFIGGPPRVGKSIFAYALAERIKGHVVSTDSIRDAARKACTDKTSDLFAMNEQEQVSQDEWLRVRNQFPQEIVNAQNRESLSLWPSIVSFMNSFADDSANHIIEGVAILPNQVSKMYTQPKHIIFIGNTSELHSKEMIQYGIEHPEQDWMIAMGYSKDKVIAMASYVKVMSEYFKREANHYGYKYIEISDLAFNESIGKAIATVVGD